MIHARPLLLAAALLGAAACTTPADRVEEALALRLAGKPREALEVLGAVLADLGDRRLPAAEAELRILALRNAADTAYLEVGDYQAAVAYYRRLVALAPDGEDALRARAAIGDIYRDRLGDPVAAIAQYAGIAASDTPEAARYQLEVARAYFGLGNLEQAGHEAQALWVRWPKSPFAGEARLLAAGAHARAGRTRDALEIYESLSSAGEGALSARAAVEAAALHAEEARFDRALALYEAALADHPNPELVRTHAEAVKRRRAAAAVQRPGDRAAALENRSRPPSTRKATR